MEDNINQIRTSLLNNDDAGSQRGRRAYTSIDLQSGQNLQQGAISNNQLQNNDNTFDKQGLRNVPFRNSVGGVSQAGNGVRMFGSDVNSDRQQHISSEILANNQNNNDDENINDNENEDDDNENLNDEEYDKTYFEMSKLFISIFNDNRLFIVAVIFCDIVMGAIAMIVYNSRCSMSDLQQWNLQWGYYFFAKAVYHFLVFLQFFSQDSKLDICEKLGEFRSPEENLIRERDYEIIYTDRQRSQIRRSLEKQFLDYYYKRTSILKWSFYLKSLITLSYVIYGLVVFFKGNYFSIWISNTSNTQQSCDYALTWWVYLSIIFVIACNRQIFDLILIIVILIPILLFFYLPYVTYKNCKKKRKRKQLFKDFKTIKYSVGKVQGETECAICRMDYIIDENITILPCNELHHFHKDCIMSWLNVNMTCPLCRFNFAEEENVEENQNENNNDQQVPQYIPPPNNFPNNNQGQIVFQNNQPQQQYQYQNQQPNQYLQNNNQQQQQQQQQQQYIDQNSQENLILQQMLELCNLFTTQRELQVFLDQNQYPPELQIVIIQLWNQRRQGLI